MSERYIVDIPAKSPSRSPAGAPSLGDSAMFLESVDPIHSPNALPMLDIGGDEVKSEVLDHSQETVLVAASRHGSLRLASRVREEIEQSGDDTSGSKKMAAKINFRDIDMPAPLLFMYDLLVMRMIEPDDEFKVIMRKLMFACGFLYSPCSIAFGAYWLSQLPNRPAAEATALAVGAASAIGVGVFAFAPIYIYARVTCRATPRMFNFWLLAITLFFGGFAISIPRFPTTTAMYALCEAAVLGRSNIQPVVVAFASVVFVLAQYNSNMIGLDNAWTLAALPSPHAGTPAENLLLAIISYFIVFLMTVALALQGIEFMHHIGAAAATAKMSKCLAAYIRQCDNAAVERTLLKYKESDDMDEKLHEDFRNIADTINNFTRYVPKEVVTALIQEGALAAGMETKSLTLLFTDIEGFTSMCETMTPDELVDLTDAYFDQCTRTLLMHGCTIDKFIGDAIMGFWGAPLPHNDQGHAACCGALHLQGVIDEVLVPKFHNAGYGLRTRVGIHKGNAVVGNMGCKWRLSYTALGDSVNLASRLEGLNKAYGSRILVSEAVLDDVVAVHGRCDFGVRRCGLARVKGKLDATAVYTLFGIPSNAKLVLNSLPQRLPGMLLLSTSGEALGSFVGSPRASAVGARAQSPGASSRRGSLMSAVSARSRRNSQTASTVNVADEIVKPYTAVEAFDLGKKYFGLDEAATTCLRMLTSAQRRYEDGEFAAAAEFFLDAVAAYQARTGTPGTQPPSLAGSRRMSRTLPTAVAAPSSAAPSGAELTTSTATGPESPRSPATKKIGDLAPWPMAFSSNGLTLERVNAFAEECKALAEKGRLPEEWDPVKVF